MIENIPSLIRNMQRPVDPIVIKKVVKEQHVNLYQAVNGKYFTTNSGKRVSKAVVEKAVREKIVVAEWPDKPTLQYWKLNLKFLKA